MLRYRKLAYFAIELHDRRIAGYLSRQRPCRDLGHTFARKTVPPRLDCKRSADGNTTHTHDDAQNECGSVPDSWLSLPLPGNRQSIYAREKVGGLPVLRA